jgi:hypothetical protein
MSNSYLHLRALNEYRRVSPLTYLGLRYALEATAAQQDRWAKEVAPDILMRESSPSYFLTHQYKERNRHGNLDFREMAFPSGSEALAEAALLEECSKRGGPFSPHDDVFSYRLAAPNSPEGIYKPYFELYAARQSAIGKACRKYPQHVVLYVDIRRFYPSIPIGRAVRVWQKAAAKARLSGDWIAVGRLLLERQRRTDQGFLIGPVFNHLVANLILADFDKLMRQSFQGRYFRYVDDLALVVPDSERKQVVKLIRGELKRLGFKVNPKKTQHLAAADWASTAPYQGDYYEEDDRNDLLWMRFIDHLKSYLLLHPENTRLVRDTFREDGFRIPLPRYEQEITSAKYQLRFENRRQSKRFLEKIRNVTVHSISVEAHELRELYLSSYRDIWAEHRRAEGMKRKWYCSRLRYLLSKLLLTASKKDLAKVSDDLSGKEEFVQYREIARAVLSRDVSALVAFGGKVCAGAGQALATTGGKYSCSPKRWGVKAVHGYMTLLLLGVDIDSEPPVRVTRGKEVMFATGNFERNTWREIDDPFFRDLFALAGKASLKRHRAMLQSPLDPDERWVVLADELGEISG